MIRWSFPAKAGLEANRMNKKPRQNRIRNLPNLMTSSFPFLLDDYDIPCLGNLTNMPGWRQGKTGGKQRARVRVQDEEPTVEGAGCKVLPGRGEVGSKENPLKCR
jgi:hypothetical protein